MLIKHFGGVDIRLLSITLSEPLSLHYIVRRHPGSTQPQYLFLLREIDAKLLRTTNLNSTERTEQCIRTLVNQQVRDHVWATQDELRALKTIGVLSIRVPKAALVTVQTVIKVLRHFDEDFTALVLETVIASMMAEQRCLAQVLLHIKRAVFEASLQYGIPPTPTASVSLLQNFFQKQIFPGAMPYPPPWVTSFGLEESAPILDLRGASLLIYLLRYPIVQATTCVWNSLLSPLATLQPIDRGGAAQELIDNQCDSINSRYLPATAASKTTTCPTTTTTTTTTATTTTKTTSNSTRIGALGSKRTTKARKAQQLYEENEFFDDSNANSIGLPSLPVSSLFAPPTILSPSLQTNLVIASKSAAEGKPIPAQESQESSQHSNHSPSLVLQQPSSSQQLQHQHRRQHEQADSSTILFRSDNPTTTSSHHSTLSSLGSIAHSTPTIPQYTPTPPTQSPFSPPLGNFSSLATPPTPFNPLSLAIHSKNPQKISLPTSPSKSMEVRTLQRSSMALDNVDNPQVSLGDIQLHNPTPLINLPPASQNQSSQSSRPPPADYITLNTSQQTLVTTPFLFPLFPTAQRMVQKLEHHLTFATQLASKSRQKGPIQVKKRTFRAKTIDTSTISSPSLETTNMSSLNELNEEYQNLDNPALNNHNPPVDVEIKQISDAIDQMSLHSLADHQESHTSMFLAFTPEATLEQHDSKQSLGTFGEIQASHRSALNTRKAEKRQSRMTEDENGNGDSEDDDDDDGDDDDGDSDNDDCADDGRVVGDGTVIERRSEPSSMFNAMKVQDATAFLPILLHVVFQHPSYSYQHHAKQKLHALHQTILNQISNSSSSVGNTPTTTSHLMPNVPPTMTSLDAVAESYQNDQNVTDFAQFVQKSSEKSEHFGMMDASFTQTPTTMTPSGQSTDESYEDRTTKIITSSSIQTPSLNSILSPLFSPSSISAIQDLIAKLPVYSPQPPIHPNTHINIATYSLIPSPYQSTNGDGPTVFPLIQFFFKPMSLAILPLLLLPRFQFRTRPSFFFHLYPEKVLRYRPYKMHEDALGENGKVGESQAESSSASPTTQANPSTQNAFFNRQVGETDIEVFERIMNLHHRTKRVGGFENSIGNMVHANTSTQNGSVGDDNNILSRDMAPSSSPTIDLGSTSIQNDVTSIENAAPSKSTKKGAAKKPTTKKKEKKAGTKAAEPDEDECDSTSPHSKHPAYGVSYKATELFRASLLKAPARVPTYHELKNDRAPEVNLLVQAPYLIDCARCRGVMRSRQENLHRRREMAAASGGATEEDFDAAEGLLVPLSSSEERYPYVCFCHFLPVKKSAAVLMTPERTISSVAVPPVNTTTTTTTAQTETTTTATTTTTPTSTIITSPQPSPYPTVTSQTATVASSISPNVPLPPKNQPLFHFKPKISGDGAADSALPLLTTQLTHEDLSYLSLPGIVAFPLLFALATLYQRTRHPYPYPIDDQSAHDQRYQRYNSQLMLSSFQWIMSELKQPIIYNTTILELSPKMTANLYPKGQQPDLYCEPDDAPIPPEDLDLMDDDFFPTTTPTTTTSTTNNSIPTRNSHKKYAHLYTSLVQSLSESISSQNYYIPDTHTTNSILGDRSTTTTTSSSRTIINAIVPPFLSPLSPPTPQIAQFTNSNPVQNQPALAIGPTAAPQSTPLALPHGLTVIPPQPHLTRPHITLNTAGVNSKLSLPGLGDTLYTHESPLINLPHNHDFPYQLNLESLPLFRSFLYHLEALEPQHKLRLWRHAGLVYSVTPQTHCILELDQVGLIQSPQQYAGKSPIAIINGAYDLLKGKDCKELGDVELYNLYGVARPKPAEITPKGVLSETGHPSSSLSTLDPITHDSSDGVMKLEDYIEQKIIKSIIEREMRRKAALAVQQPHRTITSGKGNSKTTSKIPVKRKGRGKNALQNHGLGGDDDDDGELGGDGGDGGDDHDDDDDSQLGPITSVDQFRTLDPELKKVLYQKYVAKSNKPGRKPLEYHLLNNSYPEWAKKQLHTLKQSYHAQFQQLVVQNSASNTSQDQLLGSDQDSNRGIGTRRSVRVATGTNTPSQPNSNYQIPSLDQIGTTFDNILINHNIPLSHDNQQQSLRTHSSAEITKNPSTGSLKRVGPPNHFQALDLARQPQPLPLTHQIPTDTFSNPSQLEQVGESILVDLNAGLSSPRTASFELDFGSMMMDQTPPKQASYLESFDVHSPAFLPQAHHPGHHHHHIPHHPSQQPNTSPQLTQDIYPTLPPFPMFSNHPINFSSTPSTPPALPSVSMITPATTHPLFDQSSQQSTGHHHPQYSPTLQSEGINVNIFNPDHSLPLQLNHSEDNINVIRSFGQYSPQNLYQPLATIGTPLFSPLNIVLSLSPHQSPRVQPQDPPNSMSNTSEDSTTQVIFDYFG